MKSRAVKDLIEPQMVIEGADVRLLRSFSPHESNLYDPFLLFDHFAFNDPVEGPIRGFPTHPHRGIETVTYMLEGNVQHRDSLGNSGVIGPGDVQWMTAGGGILHEEMPRRGPDGTIYGFQLWVNLPASLKMSRPNYQEVKAVSIPESIQDGISIRVVTGTVYGIEGPVRQIAAKPLYLDVKLAGQSTFTQSIPSGHTALIYVFEGEGEIANQSIKALSMVVLEDGDTIQIQAGDVPMRFMVMAGLPFREKIAPYGPFVMNTRDEIAQALADLRDGTFVKN